MVPSNDDRHASKYNAESISNKAALTTAEIPSRLEPRGLARDDGKRPDGVTSMPWKNGRCLMWDVTCPDTLAASYLDKAVTGPGVVATEAETRKRQKYSTVDDSVTRRTFSSQLPLKHSERLALMLSIFLMI